VLKTNRNINAAEFWKEINKLRKREKENVNRIDGISDNKDIAKRWRDTFMEIGMDKMNEGGIKDYNRLQNVEVGVDENTMLLSDCVKCQRTPPDSVFTSNNKYI